MREVPPEAIALAEPLFCPKHNGAVNDVELIDGPLELLMLTVDCTEHPFASVTVTV